MQLKGFELFILINIAISAYSAKLLRVPKIYNALITSKEKILPSEAYPGTTGPIFQPIGLPIQTLFLQPPVFVEGIAKKDDLNVRNGENDDKVSSDKSKILQPVTFYPRYSVYYANQPHLILPYPYFYTPFNLQQPSSQPIYNNFQDNFKQELENDDRKESSYERSKTKSSQPSSGSSEQKEYFKNNRPADRNIPDIPPPPPPIRYKFSEN